jgi:small subunit ribosomal protein S27Ae
MAEKKFVAKKKSVQIWKIFEKKGDSVERKNKACPKCGPGFFMAKHASRWTCGKCKWTEFISVKK